MQTERPACLVGVDVLLLGVSAMDEGQRTRRHARLEFRHLVEHVAVAADDVELSEVREGFAHMRLGQDAREIAGGANDGREPTPRSAAHQRPLVNVVARGCATPELLCVLGCLLAAGATNDDGLARCKASLDDGVDPVEDAIGQRVAHEDEPRQALAHPRQLLGDAHTHFARVLHVDDEVHRTRAVVRPRHVEEAKVAIIDHGRLWAARLEETTFGFWLTAHLPGRFEEQVAVLTVAAPLVGHTGVGLQMDLIPEIT
jgi:hypothetical protein